MIFLLTQYIERRVKCDEGKPTCQRCTGIGRDCKGYEALPLHWKPVDARINRDRQNSWASSSDSCSDSKQDTGSSELYEQKADYLVQSIQKPEEDEVPMCLIKQNSPSSSDSEWTFYYSPSIFDKDSQRAINFFNEKTINQISRFINLRECSTSHIIRFLFLKTIMESSAQDSIYRVNYQICSDSLVEIS